MLHDNFGYVLPKEFHAVKTIMNLEDESGFIDANHVVVDAYGYMYVNSLTPVFDSPEDIFDFPLMIKRSKEYPSQYVIDNVYCRKYKWIKQIVTGEVGEWKFISDFITNTDPKAL
jgi:hypothetical protein